MSTTNAERTISWQGVRAKNLPNVPRWIEPLGRVGYAAKGIVYGIVGFLAFQLAIGSGGEIAGARDAIDQIGEQSYGRLMLIVMAIGLIGYTSWRFVQCVKDTEGNGTGFTGLAKRFGYALSGVAYLLLGFYAAAVVFGSGRRADGAANLQEVAVSSSGGRIILGVAGVITVGVACYLVVKGFKGTFLEKYRLGTMSETQRKIAFHAGRTGLVTRGIAFAIIGGFIALAAYRGTANGEIAGMSDALAAIASQPFGKLLLGMTGFGLMCYGVHMMLMSFFRRFNVEG